jgi:hypothetical protein
MSGHLIDSCGMSTEKKLSRNLIDEFRQFITSHRPSLVSRHLRSLLMDYMISQQQSGLPVDFRDWLVEFDSLFELLDCAADEWEE